MSKHQDKNIEDAVENKEVATKFYLTAKAAVFGPDGRVLILTRAEGDRRGPGKLDLPGGHVDPDESVEETIRREVREESGLALTDIAVLPMHVHTVADDGTEIQKFRFIAFTEETEVTLDPAEHSAYAWLTPDEAIAKLSDKGYESDKRETIIQALKYREEHDALNGWKRCQADFENYKKRQDASQKEMGKYLVERLLNDLIPVLDNFHAASSHVPEESKGSPWVTGIGYIEKQLEETLSSHGVTVIAVKEGDTFDPNIHEALSVGEGESEDGRTEVVTKVLQNGYKIGDRVVRAVKVEIQ